MAKANYLNGINRLLDHYRSGEALEVGFSSAGGQMPNEVHAVGLLTVQNGAVHFMLEGRPES